MSVAIMGSLFCIGHLGKGMGGGGPLPRTPRRSGGGRRLVRLGGRNAWDGFVPVRQPTSSSGSSLVPRYLGH